MTKNSNKLFVSGIDTEIGKTIVSAILVEALQADYWKVVQAGLDEETDAEKVARLAVNHGHIFEEQYRLKTPMSPDAAAAIDGVQIDIEKCLLPEGENNLIVEGAGGLLVPLNEDVTIIDLIAHLQLPVVLVSRHYLGSINHTLLSVEALQRRNIPIKLLVFVGDHPTSVASILKHSGIENYCSIPLVEEVDEKFIQEQASMIRKLL